MANQEQLTRQVANDADGCLTNALERDRVVVRYFALNHTFAFLRYAFCGEYPWWFWPTRRAPVGAE
jgi:hypothetical protein